MHICICAGEIISVTHSKGGAGKTSLTFNLAYALAAAGARVLVVDLDTQMGQSSFLDQFGNADSDRDSGWLSWVGATLTKRSELRST